MGIKRECLLLAALLVIISGCGPKAKKAANSKKTKKTQKMVRSEKIAPEAKDMAFVDGIAPFFDSAEDLEDFLALTEDDTSDAGMEANDLAWLDDMDDDVFGWDASTDLDRTKGVKPIYFGFNRYGVAGDQTEALEQTATTIKQALKEADQKGEQLTVVVEGHADHAAGTGAYNVAISEKRATSVADRLKAAGVPAERIKVVGRGAEVPMIADGRQVTGSREEQWANRRVETHFVHA